MTTSQVLKQTLAPTSVHSGDYIDISGYKIANKDTMASLIPFTIPENPGRITAEQTSIISQIQNTITVGQVERDNGMLITTPTRIKEGNDVMRPGVNKTQYKEFSYNFYGLTTSYKLYSKKPDDADNLATAQNKEEYRLQQQQQLSEYYNLLPVLYFDPKSDVYNQSDFFNPENVKIKGFHNAIHANETTTGTIVTTDGKGNEKTLANILIDYLNGLSGAYKKFEYDTVLFPQYVINKFMQVQADSASSVADQNLWSYITRMLSQTDIRRIIPLKHYNNVDTNKHMMVLYDSSKLYRNYSSIRRAGVGMPSSKILLLQAFDLKGAHDPYTSLTHFTRTTFLPDIVFTEDGACQVFKLKWTTT